MTPSRLRRLIPALLLGLAASTSALAQAPLTTHTLSLGEAASPPAAITEVAWIAGHWRGEALGGVAEEIWSAPAAGTMMGVFRLMRQQSIAFYEILAIAEEDGSLVLRLKHFDAQLRGWEEKDEAVTFRLVRLEDGRAYFDGMTFEQRSPDEIAVYVAMRTGQEEPREAVFVYRRVAS